MVTFLLVMTNRLLLQQLLFCSQLCFWFCSGLPVQEEEEEDSEDTSSSSQELEEATLREEKALSDSEVKVRSTPPALWSALEPFTEACDVLCSPSLCQEVQKLEERGKVSSIRIRKALPKAQNNLTPMGLPRAVR